MGVRNKKSNDLLFRFTWPCVYPSIYGSEPPMSTRIISLCRVLTSLVPPVHNQGVSSAPLQGLALWNIFLPTTGSFFVCCITDFFPVTAPSGGRFPVTFHLLLNSSYHGWSQPSSSLSEGLRPAMIHCFFLFMLLAVFLVLRCHSASSDHHNPHLWLVSYKISGSAYMPPLSLTASFSVDFSPLSGNNYESL